MHHNTFILLLVVFLTILPALDAWWLVGSGNNRQCPRRGSASPYYFGTTDLSCMLKGKRKRRAPSRGVWDYKHRFIYYQGYYFEFSNRGIFIDRNRIDSHRCSGGLESSPAGYSYLDVECIKKCASNYKCNFGNYDFLFNNCHHFANRLSEVLCTRTSCPSWCYGC